MSLLAWNAEAERELLACACMDSLWLFCAEAVGLAHNPKTQWFQPSTHKPLCDWLQWHGLDWLAHRDQNLQKFLMVVWPRECGKTSIATRAFPMWLSLHDPDLSIAIGGETHKKGREWFAPVRQVLSGTARYALFTWLFGNWKSEERLWKNAAIVHAARCDLSLQDPSFSTWGVFNGMVGGHPDLAILDDPNSPEMLQKNHDWLQVVSDHVADLYPVMKRNGMLLLPGTRYGSADHFGTGITVEGIASLTGMAPPEGVQPKPGGQWHLYYMSGRGEDGKPTFPRVWSEARMKKMARRKSYVYATQVLNDPTQSEQTPLQPWQVEEWKVDLGNVPRNYAITIHGDTAFAHVSRQSRGDESVVLVVAHPLDGTGDIYFLEGVGSRDWRVENYYEQFVLYVQKYRRLGKTVRGITDELELGGRAGSWAQAIRGWFASRGVVCPPVYQIQRAGRGKAVRKSELAAYGVNGHVHIVRNAPGSEQLTRQLLRLGEPSAPDDWTDPLGDAFYKEIYRPMLVVGAPTVAKQPDLDRPFDEFLIAQPRGRVHYEDDEPAEPIY